MHNFEKKLINNKFSFSKQFKWFALASLLIILLGIVILSVFGFNLGLDFTGGSEIKVKIGASLEQKEEYNKSVDIVKKVFVKNDIAFGSIQKEGSGSDLAIVVRFKDEKGKTSEQMEEIRLKISTDIKADLISSGTDTLGLEVTQTYKGASSTTKILLNALLATGLAVISILIYIAVRFEFYSGLAAVLALMHDVLVMIALSVICRIQINSAFIAAIITIIGYSINNTIIVFDRVRENWRGEKYSGIKVCDIVDVSIKETLVRTLNTTLTTLVAVFMLAILGTASVKEFIIPIIFGLIAGSYSSTFLAGPIFGIIADKINLKPRRKKLTK